MENETKLELNVLPDRFVKLPNKVSTKVEDDHSVKLIVAKCSNSSPIKH